MHVAGIWSDLSWSDGTTNDSTQMGLYVEELGQDLISRPRTKYGPSYKPSSSDLNGADFNKHDMLSIVYMSASSGCSHIPHSVRCSDRKDRACVGPRVVAVSSFSS